MSEPLDDRYLTWLYSLVGDVKLKSPSRTYWKLLRQLYTKEFVWFVPNDDNRVEDGRDLRYEFADLIEDDAWLSLGCSMLEMMIGLARRLSFEADGEPAVWFWHLIDNLGFTKFNDRRYDDQIAEEVDEVLQDVIWRNFNPNGEGGLFPLRRPHDDQRLIEIWYQMNAYIIENV
jgi:hypothetical protein